MSNLKTGDSAIVIDHPTIPMEHRQFIGIVVTIGEVCNRSEFEKHREMYGTLWYVSMNGTPVIAAELILRKIDPPPQDMLGNGDTETPDKQISWNDCIWKPTGVTA